MRWFKHMSDSADDEKLASLLGTHGVEGYGLWWFILEVVAKQIPKDSDKCSVSYPLAYWLRITGIYHHAKLRKMLQSMHDLRLMSVQCPNNVGNISSISLKDVLTISIPNLLKFRDEYSKKSGQKKDTLRSKMEREMEIQKQTLKPFVEPVKKPARQVKEQLSESDWISSLKTDPSFVGIDIDRELAKCATWCKHNHKLNSRRRIIAWLLRADKTITALQDIQKLQPVETINPVSAAHKKTLEMYQ